MNYDKIKSSFRARIDDKGKPIKNIANYGLPVNGIAVRLGKGEYTNFTVKMLEPVRPLLTDYRVMRAISKLDKGEILAAGSILGLDREMNEYGINIVYTAITIWLEKNEVEVPDDYRVNCIKDIDEKLRRWILTVRNKPLLNRFKIISIGQSKKGHSVVPESWLDREFADGYELHKEMDKLDWRKGKPPVHLTAGGC